MQFNTEKSQALLYQHMKFSETQVAHTDLGRITIFESKPVPNLDIHMNNDAPFQVEIINLVIKIKSWAGWILQNFQIKRKGSYNGPLEDFHSHFSSSITSHKVQETCMAEM